MAELVYNTTGAKQIQINDTTYLYNGELDQSNNASGTGVLYHILNLNYPEKTNKSTQDLDNLFLEEKNQKANFFPDPITESIFYTGNFVNNFPEAQWGTFFSKDQRIIRYPISGKFPKGKNKAMESLLIVKEMFYRKGFLIRIIRIRMEISVGFITQKQKH